MIRFFRKLLCFHDWKRESSLVVCRAEMDGNGKIDFRPDHIRYYCHLCGATKKKKYIPPQ